MRPSVQLCKGFWLFVLLVESMLAVSQVPWAQGGKLVAACWPAGGQLLPRYQACAAQAEADHQAAVHCTRADWPAGAVPVFHV